MLESDLHVRVLNSKLNPELAKYLDIARSELDYGWEIDVPQPLGRAWTRQEYDRKLTSKSNKNGQKSAFSIPSACSCPA